MTDTELQDQAVKTLFNAVGKALIADGKINPEGKTQEQILREVAVYIKKNPLTKDTLKIGRVTYHDGLSKKANLASESGHEKQALGYMKDSINDITQSLCDTTLTKMRYNEQQIEILSSEWNLSAMIHHIYAYFRSVRPDKRLTRILEDTQDLNALTEYTNFSELSYIYQELKRVQDADLYKGANQKMD